jgi:hypothetical protein
MEFRAFFSSTEWLGTKLQSSDCFSLLQNSLECDLSFFIFRGKARESERNSERFPFRDEKDENLTEGVKISVRSVFH